MSDDTPEEAIERGLQAYFAGDTIRELLDGIDVDALAEGAALDDAVEYEQLGRVLGSLLGRAAAKGTSNSGLLGRFIKESVGSEMGGRVGEAVVTTLVERGDLDTLVERIEDVAGQESLDDLAEEVTGTEAGSAVEGVSGTGPDDEADWTGIDVETDDE